MKNTADEFRLGVIIGLVFAFVIVVLSLLSEVTLERESKLNTETELGQAIEEAIQIYEDVDKELRALNRDAAKLSEDASNMEESAKALADQVSKLTEPKAIPFNMIDATTMEVVSYPEVSKGKDATIFLFW